VGGRRVLAAAGSVDRAERQRGRLPPYGLDDDVRASVFRLLEDEATPIDVATRAQLKIAVGVPRATDDGFRRALKGTARLVPTAEAVRQDLEGWWAQFALPRAVGHALHMRSPLPTARGPRGRQRAARRLAILSESGVPFCRIYECHFIAETGALDGPRGRICSGQATSQGDPEPNGRRGRASRHLGPR
jgi:hypothetical protein